MPNTTYPQSGPRTIVASLTVAVAMMSTAPPAEAKIKCNGPWQIVKGVGEIATPYCGDGYLAKVARSYGVKVSARSIRNNPSRKQDVCQLIGHDSRVDDICAGFGNDGNNDRR